MYPVALQPLIVSRGPYDIPSLSGPIFSPESEFTTSWCLSTGYSSLVAVVITTAYAVLELSKLEYKQVWFLPVLQKISVATKRFKPAFKAVTSFDYRL